MIFTDTGDAPAVDPTARPSRELVSEVRDVDTRLKKLTALMAQTVAEYGSRLPEVDGRHWTSTTR